MPKACQLKGSDFNLLTKEVRLAPFKRKPERFLPLFDDTLEFVQQWQAHAWHDVYGLLWYGKVWYGMVWYGMLGMDGCMYVWMDGCVKLH